MTRYYITFSGNQYDHITEKIVKNGPKFGADKVLVYDDLWLMDQEFYELNHWAWEHHGDQRNNKRGFGWFCWKPFIIMDALSKAEPGDIVLYSDGDTYPIDSLMTMYEECARIGGIMLFNALGNNHRHWCKRDCYVVMAQDDPAYYDVTAGVARFMLFQKGPWKAQQFLMEWLTYCVNPLATTFDDSVLGPEIGLHEHRTEQAIMTNLAYKYHLKLYREACQFGESSMDDRNLYQQTFFQDGSRVEDILGGSKFANIVPWDSATPASIIRRARKRFEDEQGRPWLDCPGQGRLELIESERKRSQAR